MHPTLLRFGPLEIRSYGLMLAISFVIGILWAMARSDKRGIDRNRMMDMSMILIVSAIVGSRLMYILTHLYEFRGRWLDTVSPIQSTGEIGLPGLTMLGGVILCLIGLVIFCRMNKIPILKLSDVVAPCFGLGIFLTRIGCFLAGCCFGEPSDLPWCVVFPTASPAGSVHFGVHIHPTQLYSSLYGLIIVLIIIWLDRRPRFDGFITAVFFMLYGVSRFSVDFVRYYESTDQFRILHTAFTFNQLISFLMFTFGLISFVWLNKKHKKKDNNS